MKIQKLIISVILLLALHQFSFGQTTTAGFIPRYFNHVNGSQILGNSIIYQKNSTGPAFGTIGKIGIGTITPYSTLHVHKASEGTVDNIPVLTITNEIYRAVIGGPLTSKSSNIINSSMQYEIYDYGTYYKSETGLIKGSDNKTAFYFKISNSEKMRIDESGNIGIGTNNPIARLHVNGASGQEAMRIQVNGATKLIVSSGGGLSVGSASTAPNNGLYVNGNAGFGIASPTAKLHVNIYGSGIISKLANTYADIEVNGITSYASIKNLKTNGLLINTNNNDYQLYLAPTGGVGIGTQNIYEYKLAIAGSMIAEEIIVKLQEDWPDYVFEDNYNLKSLNEVEVFVKENKHLPNVPSANEIRENGINVSEMNTILMEKIEELTLYTIEQQKLIDRLIKEVEILKETNK